MLAQQYFNQIDKPDLEACYLAGYSMDGDGDVKQENPHMQGSREAFFWEEGWWDGFYQEPVRFIIEQTPANDSLFGLIRNNKWRIFGSSLVATAAAVGYLLMDVAA